MVRNKLFFRKGLRFLLIGFSAMLLTLKPSFAQVFPVQAYINVTPPYSVYLSQYTASDQEKILATILLRDPVITSIEVKFRFTIQGAGIKLTTNPSWNPASYTLVSGVSVILPQEMIADYLKPQHLLIEGIDPQEFYRSGKLPEGYYQFKVEVIEYRRNITISNTAQAGLWLMLNEPPRIVFPLPNQKVTATNPQMLNFAWVPGGISSPQSSLSTMYEFTLVELADKSVDPYIAITTASNATKYVKILDQTNLFYGPGEMLLTPGETYAIRVRAYTTDGFDMFKNNGYSDVRVFTFGDACAAPVSFTLQNPNQSSFEVNVVTDPTNTAWQAQFRESSVTDGQWSELKSEPGTNIKTIRGLKASTSYDVQIKGLCGDIPSDYSQTQTIQTTEMVNGNRSCNNSASTFITKDAPALTNLKKDDVFLAGLFPIKVKSVTSQGGGKFSGLGIATLPLFNTGIGVTFDNVGINDLMQLTSGEVKGVRDQFNITLFGDSQTTTTGGGTGNTTGGQTTGGETYPPSTDTVTIPSVYDSIVIVDNNTILVYTPTGTQTYTVNLGGNSSTLVVPADHNMDNAKIIYDNAVHPYTPGLGGSMNTEPKDFKGFIAYFTDKYQLHGFDTLYPGISKLANYYKQFPIAGKQFYVPWKALKVDQPEPIDLSIKQGTDKLPFSSVKVKQLYIGDITPSSGAGTQKQTFMVKGSYKGAEDNVIAYYNADDKEQIAGGIYLATYGEEKFKLILVPFPGVKIADIRGSLSYGLSSIYSQAVVSWSVDTLAGFPGIDLGDNGLDWADKEMLSSYNAEMNSAISAFKDWKTNPDPDAYYLFVVPSFSQTDVEGYMPRNRRFGFVTKDQLDARTIAHELGHGAFNLYHTFSTNGWGIAENSTSNLMDYNNGNKLWKPQWDLIHNPEVTTGLFDGMDEGASIKLDNLLKTIREANLKNTKSLPIVRDKCEKKAFGNFTLGNKKLTYIHLLCGDLQKTDVLPYNIDAATQFSLQSILNTSSININPSEMDKEEVTGTRDGIKYIIYRFHEIKSNNAPLSPSYTDNVLFHVMVRMDESKDFEDYVFPTWEYLITKEELSPSEIAVVRKGIENETDVEKKKKLYLNLQEKVKYVNQRTNTSESYNAKKGKTEKIGNVMCQLTCLSRCLEYFGKSNPSNTLSFPDYLEKLHNDKFSSYERESHDLWIKLANEFDIEGKYISGINFNSNLTKDELTDKLLTQLCNGYAVILGITCSDRTRGHIVRLQNVTDKGLIVDDPYGEEDPLKRWKYPTDKVNYWIKYNSESDTNSSAGNNNLWEWDKIEKLNIFTAIFFKNK